MVIKTSTTAIIDIKPEEFSRDFVHIIIIRLMLDLQAPCVDVFSAMLHASALQQVPLHH